MARTTDGELSALVRGRLPARFERRVVTIDPGGNRPYAESEWRDAIVIVARGEVDVEGGSGRRYRFGSGAVLRLGGVPLRAVHNPGDEPAVLVAVAPKLRAPPS